MLIFSLINFGFSLRKMDILYEEGKSWIATLTVLTSHLLIWDIRFYLNMIFWGATFGCWVMRKEECLRLGDAKGHELGKAYSALQSAEGSPIQVAMTVSICYLWKICLQIFIPYVSKNPQRGNYRGCETFVLLM